jgi:hypothetical protein
LNINTPVTSLNDKNTKLIWDWMQTAIQVIAEIFQQLISRLRTSAVATPDAKGFGTYGSVIECSSP